MAYSFFYADMLRTGVLLFGDGFDRFHGRAGRHRGFKLIAVHYLVLDKEFGDETELIRMFGEDALRLGVSVFDDGVYFGVYLRGNFLGVVGGA